MKNWFNGARTQWLCIGVILSLALSPSFVAAQTSDESTGAKFLSARERSETLILAVAPNCQIISQNAYQSATTKFCPKDSDWVLVSERYEDGPFLYRLSEGQLASAIVVELDEDASLSQLTPDAVRQLVDLNIYQNGPRGQMQVEEILAQDLSVDGSLLGETAIVTNTDGQKLLLQVSLRTLPTGLGLFETSQSIANTSAPYEVTEIQSNFHIDFRNKINTSYNLIRSLNDKGEVVLTFWGPR